MTTVIIQPSSQDAFADENDKANPHNGAYFALRNSGGKNCISYVQFDLSSLVGKTILSAVFWGKITLENTPGPPHPSSVDLRRCTQAWNEATLDWSPQPAVSGTLLATAAYREGLGWKDWTLDLTEFGLMIASNNGFRIKCEPTDQGGNDWQRYDSSEGPVGADKPKLVVEYAGVGGQIIWIT